MDIYALQLWADYVSAKALPPEPPQMYATLALAGVEVAGLTRVAFTYADPEVISDTEVQLSNLTAIAFSNTPDGSADEVWLLDAATGGNRWDSIAIAGGTVTLTDGGNKTFAAGELTQTIKKTA